jgi:Uncharacterized alpha/beta hydrolase domain (DUF2235)
MRTVRDVISWLVLTALTPFAFLIRIGFTYVLPLALAVGALAAIGFTEIGRTGLCIGLALGALLGPARIAGVDFRQWLRDPATPSEIRDDTWIGLARGAFHAVGGEMLLGFLALVVFETISGQGVVGGFALAGGALVGIVLLQGIVDLVWRFGLRLALPQRVPAPEYWYHRPAPLLPPKQPNPRARRLIVCCDGTWNWPESRHETNVVRLVRAIVPEHDGTAQIVHYHQGVGTGNFVDRLGGGGSGIGLSASVKACYGFLADNYQPGDEIFLFGFSRGAYVARALAGMICTIGMLQKADMASFNAVWAWYAQGRGRRSRKIADLDAIVPATRRQDVEIECIGVWDTVGALGIPGSRFCAQAFAFYELELGLKVRNAFQALAMDEQRGNFQGAIWMPSKPAAASAPGAVAQNLRQMWFPGVHSNIGGGYEEHGLSDATFLWMVDQLQTSALIGLAPASIVSALDGRSAEAYPSGKLQDSRTLLWHLIGCPVPRPVAVSSVTEKVHDSARARSTAARTTARDTYKTAARVSWIGWATGLIAQRSAFESCTIAPAASGAPPPKQKARLDFCSALLRLFGPQG